MDLFHELGDHVSELAYRLGKETPKFVIEPQGKRLTYELSDFLRDLLIHLIRNSVDHGIEDGETRTTKGKAPVGSINISFLKDKIIYKDDGKGLDLDSLRDKAKANGVSVSEHNREEVGNLIFRPGFSTAKTLTDQQENFIEVESTCCLCGTELIFEHTQDEQGTGITEHASCPCCKIQLKEKTHLLH